MSGTLFFLNYHNDTLDFNNIKLGSVTKFIAENKFKGTDDLKWLPTDGVCFFQLKLIIIILRLNAAFKKLKIEKINQKYFLEYNDAFCMTH